MDKRFIFRPHRYADGEQEIYALFDVLDRQTGEHIGMVNPVRGGYALRDRSGELLKTAWGVSRDTAAGNLRAQVRIIDGIALQQSSGVAADCPNAWHKTGSGRATQPCPECPSQTGLKMALTTIENLINGNPSSDVTAADAVALLRTLIYTPAS